MTVRVSKPAFNLRDKLSELDKPSGLKGTELMRSETSQEARDLIGSGRKNLIINGNMQIAQRGTSTTTLGYLIDRFASGAANINNPTYAQVDVASGTEPYAAGFRKAAKITGGDNAVHSNDVLKFNQGIEAQNIARSGWDYKSGGSFITLSFWVKSSVGQTFFGRLQTIDGTDQNYAFSYDVSADTWTKVVKTIPGNSNITIDNDAGEGLDIEWTLYRGTDTTSSATVVNKWQAYSSGGRLPDGVPSTWHDTNGATWEITGVQLEVGKNATEFEHRSYAEELALCQRYFEEINLYGANTSYTGGGYNRHIGEVFWKVEKRAIPTCNGPSVGNYQPGGGSGTVSISGPTIHGGVLNSGNTNSTYPDGWINSGAILEVDAEL